MNVSNMFPSKYLKAADLGQREFELTIHSVSLEDVGTEQAPDHKPVMYFKGAEKGLVLNKTNAETIAYLYGAETDAWAGKKVTLFTMAVQFNGRMVPAIRLRGMVAPSNGAVGGDPAQQRPPATSPGGGGEMSSAGGGIDLDDEIPF